MELLTAEEMAKILRVSARTFRSCIDEYEIPYVQIGKRKRFESEKVLAKLETRGQRLEITPNFKSRIKPEISKKNDKYRKLLNL